jgi:hypothetical protein
LAKGHSAAEGGKVTSSDVKNALEKYGNEKKSYVAGQLAESYKAYIRGAEKGRHAAEITATAFAEIEKAWGDPDKRLAMLPGKDALSAVNRHLQGTFGVSVSPSAIVEAMYVDEVPTEMKELISLLDDFASTDRPA